MRSWFFVFLLLMQPAFAESSLTCVVTLTEQIRDFPPRKYENSEKNISFNGNTVSDLKNKMYDPEEKLVRISGDWFLVKHCKFDNDVLRCEKGKNDLSRSHMKLRFDFGDFSVSSHSTLFLFSEA